MPLPPDRGHLATEQRHERSSNLDALDVRGCIDLIVDDHRAVPEAIAAAAGEIESFVEDLVPRLREGGRLIYLGAGTSGRLGVLDAAECPPTFSSDPSRIVGIIAGGDAALRRSSEQKEDDPDGAAAALDELAVSETDTLLGIAAGGTTPFVLGGIALAGARGAMTGLLTCAVRHARPEVDHLIFLDTGPELLTGSTRLKAGSATKLALNIITTTAFVRLGKVYGNLMVDVRATSDKLLDRAIRIMTRLSPELARADAARLIRDASGRLKVAIVMERLGVDRTTAERVLEEHRDMLRQIIGPP